LNEISKAFVWLGRHFPKIRFQFYQLVLEIDSKMSPSRKSYVFSFRKIFQEGSKKFLSVFSEKYFISWLASPNPSIKIDFSANHITQTQKAFKNNFTQNNERKEKMVSFYCSSVLIPKEPLNENFNNDV